MLGSLYDYNARHYSPALGRFLSPDTIVPSPGNPSHGDFLRSQSLNRYAYVLNNPLRYTDPTGMFSEDEIMTYLDVDSWEAVLALFGEGGRYAGLWGWLEVLRQAEIGSTFGIYTATGGQVFSGRFAQGDDGYLFLEGEYLKPSQGWVYPAHGRPYYVTANSSANLPSEAAAWLGAGGGYYVNASSIAAHTRYQHLKFDPSRIDQQALRDELQSAAGTVGGGLVVAGVGSGNIPLAAAGGALVLNGVRVDISATARSVANYRKGTISGWELVADLVVTGGGYTPMGPYFDAVSIGRTISRGFYLTQ